MILCKWKWERERFSSLAAPLLWTALLDTLNYVNTNYPYFWNVFLLILLLVVVWFVKLSWINFNLWEHCTQWGRWDRLWEIRFESTIAMFGQGISTSGSARSSCYHWRCHWPTQVRFLCLFVPLIYFLLLILIWIFFSTPQSN